MPCPVMSFRCVWFEETGGTWALVPTVGVGVRRQRSGDGITIRVVDGPHLTVYIAREEQQGEKNRCKGHSSCCQTNK